MIDTFLNRIFTVFFDWVSPDSKHANPKCMINTKNAAISIHVLFVVNSSREISVAAGRIEIVRKKIPVILGPVSHPYISGDEIPELSEYPSIDEGLAGRLDKGGVKVGFGSYSYGLGSLAKGITGKWLLIDAAISTGYGMSEESVLRSLTLSAAEILNIENQVGSIEVDKKADLIVLNGDPLSIKTWVEQVYISGRLVYSKNITPN